MLSILTITKGIIFDQKMRRGFMFCLTLAALLLLLVGSTVASEWLREHVMVFLLYWLGVAWITFSAILLAVYDMLLIRIAARKARREIRREWKVDDFET